MSDGRKVRDVLFWLQRQHAQTADMVTDAGDASLWCKDEADRIRGHIRTALAMRDALRQALPVLRRGVHEYCDSVSVSRDPRSIAAAEWEKIRPDILAILDIARLIEPSPDADGVDTLFLDACLGRFIELSGMVNHE